MALWAVSYISFNDNELTTEFVEATDFHNAVFKHSQLRGSDEDWKADLMKLNPENVKQEFFNCDSMIEAVKCPSL